MTIGFILFCWLVGVLITDYQDARINEEFARDRAKEEEEEEEEASGAVDRKAKSNYNPAWN